MRGRKWSSCSKLGLDGALWNHWEREKLRFVIWFGNFLTLWRFGNLVKWGEEKFSVEWGGQAEYWCLLSDPFSPIPLRLVQMKIWNISRKRELLQHASWEGWLRWGQGRKVKHEPASVKVLTQVTMMNRRSAGLLWRPPCTLLLSYTVHMMMIVAEEKKWLITQLQN